VALPALAEEIDPAFTHIGAADFPMIEAAGASARLVTGAMWGAKGPLVTHSPALFADVTLGAGARVPLDPSVEERAIYVVSGEIEIAGDRFEAGRLLVFKPGDTITLTAITDARVAFLGGDALEGPRYIWWNFVSSRRERIEAAKEQWASGRFDMVPGEHEFIPLPAA
jgi:redox-sensitive bicupin YhaK (pirin superfamily)